MFKLISQDKTARRGRLETAHGTVETPAFMNVATAAAIRGGLSAADLGEIGCQVMLCNTYHLHLRPGDETVKGFGGLHGFTGWQGPILTDSGGFQVFSLAPLRKITEQGVTFASHIDGRRIFLGPEESIRIQSNLGSTIAMAFDECVANPAEYAYVKVAADRTARWLERCKSEMRRRNARGDCLNPNQLLFGINQGGTFTDIRTEHMRQIAAMGLDGYAVGGLAVGETPEEMYAVLDSVCPEMPPEKPRYLMGVGTPANILNAVERGIDLFDCVMPSRNARHGHIFTWRGVKNLNNQKYAADKSPVDSLCDCPVCGRYSAGYIRHLLKSGEMLGMRLAVIHNLYFYNTLMSRIREAVGQNRFAEFKNSLLGVVDQRI